MAFEKGKEKTGGKQKGYTSEPIKKAQEIFTSIIEGQHAHIEQALNELRVKDKAKYIEAVTRLMPYIMPKKQDISITDNTLNINVNRKAIGLKS